MSQGLDWFIPCPRQHDENNNCFMCQGTNRVFWGTLSSEDKGHYRFNHGLPYFWNPEGWPDE